MVASLALPRRFPRPLTGLPVRPAARRFAGKVVAELTRVLRPAPPRRPRLVALFVDGLAPSALASAAADGTLRFLPALRDARSSREARTFSGMPSSTASFQAGLFYGLRHPDVPGFGWYDRNTGLRVRMERPSHAAAVEARLRPGRRGLLEGGAGYLSILRGGSPTYFSTAAAVGLLEGELPPAPLSPAAAAIVHPLSLVRLVARVASESGVLLGQLLRQVVRTRTTRHELNFLWNRLLVGTLARELAVSELIIDMVRGVPRTFLTLHDYDEAAHRRGPGAATHALRSIDATIELVCAVADALPDPPDVWVFTDHGQIAAVPFERTFGMTLDAWLRGAGEGTGRPPEVPPEVARALGGAVGPARPGRPPYVVDAGNFAHVYLGGTRPLTGAEILRGHGRTLARALRCPGVGLVAVRGADGTALAFSGGRVVDPRDPATVPKGASPRAVAAMLEDLARSPSSGDIVLYGAWFPGGCVSFSWEFSSHGGVSPIETETFVIHPAGVPLDVDRVAHGADLHEIFRSLYGDEAHDTDRERSTVRTTPPA